MHSDSTLSRVDHMVERNVNSQRNVDVQRYDSSPSAASDTSISTLSHIRRADQTGPPNPPKINPRTSLPLRSNNPYNPRNPRRKPKRRRQISRRKRMVYGRIERFVLTLGCADEKEERYTEIQTRRLLVRQSMSEAEGRYAETDTSFPFCLAGEWSGRSVEGENRLCGFWIGIALGWGYCRYVCGSGMSAEG